VAPSQWVCIISIMMMVMMMVMMMMIIIISGHRPHLGRHVSLALHVGFIESQQRRHAEIVHVAPSHWVCIISILMMMMIMMMIMIHDHHHDHHHH
jgi:hypothetical protein